MTILVSILTAIIVFIGVYVFFGLFRLIADIVIVLTALVDAILAFNIYRWYPKVAEAIQFLPPEFTFKGWIICVVALSLAGALIVLPLIPFSTIGREFAKSD